MKNLLKQIVIDILTWEAKKTLDTYDPKVVSVTGSVGKTSTKDAVAYVLAQKFSVRKSVKSFNSEIGLPLTILGLPNAWGSAWGWVKNIVKGFFVSFGGADYPDWLVLEVGADHPGDIRRVSKWLRSDIVIITKLPKVPVHVEFFSSPEEVSEEKLFLLDTLKLGGCILLNYKDSLALERAACLEAGQMITVGRDVGADLRASDYKIFYDAQCPKGVEFKIEHENSSHTVCLRGVLGWGHVYATLFGASAGICLGFDTGETAQGLSDLNFPRGRMRLIAGVKDSVILDDSYNSSPTAVANALDALRTVNASGKKIAVLGDMAELGLYSEEEHKKAGFLATDTADVLVTVGVKARLMAEGARQGGMDEANIFQFDDPIKAGKSVELGLRKGDVVLVKGSQSMRMERAVEEIMARPEDKQKILVRQEEEWLSR